MVITTLIFISHQDGTSFSAVSALSAPCHSSAIERSPPCRACCMSSIHPKGTKTLGRGWETDWQPHTPVAGGPAAVNRHHRLHFSLAGNRLNPTSGSTALKSCCVATGSWNNVAWKRSLVSSDPSPALSRVKYKPGPNLNPALSFREWTQCH